MIPSPNDLLNNNNTEKLGEAAGEAGQAPFERESFELLFLYVTCESDFSGVSFSDST